MPMKRFLNRSNCILYFFVALLIGFAPLEVLTAQSQSKPEGRERLNLFRIDALKRTLRLAPESDRPHPPALSLGQHYQGNRFAPLVAEFESLPERERTAPLFLIYGNALFFLGQSEAAVGAYQKAFHRAIHPGEKSAALANFGYLLSVDKNWQGAANRLETALEIDRSRADYEAQGQALSLLGNIYIQLGDPEKGAAAHIEALEIAETLPIPWLQARQLETLGRMYALDGTYHLAEDDFEKALKIYRILEDDLGLASALSGLAAAENERGAFDRALGHQVEAISLYRDLEDQENETQGLIKLSLIYRDRGDFASALDLGEKLLSMKKAAGHLMGMAEMEGTLGTIHEKKGDLPSAIRHWETALRLFQEAGSPQQIHIVELRIQSLQDRLEGGGH